MVNLIRRCVLVGSLTSVVFLLSRGDTLAQGANRNFDLINHTGYDIYFVYVREYGDRDWGDDVMDSDTILGTNETLHVRFHNGDACRWDVKIEFRNRVNAYWNDIDLCSIDTMTVWYDWSKRNYQAAWE